MHEIGQPLHAYDRNKISSNKIKIQKLTNRVKKAQNVTLMFYLVINRQMKLIKLIFTSSSKLKLQIALV